MTLLNLPIKYIHLEMTDSHSYKNRNVIISKYLKERYFQQLFKVKAIYEHDVDVLKGSMLHTVV